MSDDRPRAENQKYQTQTLRLVAHLNDWLAHFGSAASSEPITLILQSMMDFIGADSGELRLYPSDAGQNQPGQSLLDSQAHVTVGSYGLAKELIDEVSRERKPTLIKNYPQWALELAGKPEAHGLLCALAVPVRIADQFFGVLAVTSNRDSDIFNDEDLQVAELFASLAAVTLQADLHLQTIQQSAASDSLTGLWTHSRFFEMAERTFKQAVRYERPLSAIIVDIDRFKMLNEMHGYAVGDQVLETVARNIVSRLRDSDLLGRYGGEEFVLLLPETDLEHARLAAERMRTQIAAAPTETSKGTFFVTISAGVASLESASLDRLDQLLDLANQAMHTAKLAGRNQVASYQVD